MPFTARAGYMPDGRPITLIRAGSTEFRVTIERAVEFQADLTKAIAAARRLPDRREQPPEAA